MSLSFNEFNPLFNRNGITFQTTGLAGQNRTYSGEGVLAGIYQKAAFSVGGFHFRTDGWRKNSDQNDTIANTFVQYEISSQTSVQAEVRRRDRETGELRLRFEPDDFVPNRRHLHDASLARFGFNHTFTTNSRLIGNFAYSHAVRAVRHSPTAEDENFLDLKGKDKAFGGELQYLVRLPWVNFVSGAGHIKIDSKDKFTLKFGAPPMVDVVDRFSSDLDVRHTNIYIYSYLDLIHDLSLTFGASGDFFDSDRPDSKRRNQFNPKFGIAWTPLQGTTVRGAVSRTLKRTLISDQTLEPTQVAGFNQFFDDFNATTAWRYGGAIDQKLSNTLFGGLEYTFRDLRVPFIASDVDSFKEKTVDWSEKLLRSYLFWTPREWLALSAGYSWEDLNRARLFSNGAKNVTTHRVPLAVNIFAPSGLSASLKATYHQQTGDFQRVETTGFRPGHDSFWTIDTSINYRLPKRYGFITFGATNLLNKQFKHFDTDQGAVNQNPRVIPDRVIFGKFTFAIP